MIRRVDSYLIINTFLAGTLLLIFLYSFFYASLAKHGLTITSTCQSLPEIYCRSRGLSRAFYHIMHLNFDRAASLNRYSFNIFIFFALQLAARVGFSIAYLRFQSKRLVWMDIVFSGVYFIYAFFPLTFFYYFLFEK